MDFTDDLIQHIEKAVGLKLYDDQIRYLKGEFKTPDWTYYRRAGKTTAYCIKSALSNGEPLDLRNPIFFSDAKWSGITGENARRYSKDVFVRRFLDIRMMLKCYGFPVRDIKNFSS